MATIAQKIAKLFLRGADNVIVSKAAALAQTTTTTIIQSNYEQIDIDWHNKNRWTLCRTPAHVKKALERCPPISYILYKKSLAFINGQLVLTDKKTGVELENPKEFRYYDLLQQPNILQSDIQFRIQILMTIQAFGYCPVLKVRPSGFKKEISDLFILPPTMCQFTRSGNVIGLREYSDIWDEIKFNGKKMPKEDIYVFTDITPYLNDLLLPDSRLANMGMPTTSITKNYEARASILGNRGALGAWVNSGTEFPGQVAEEEEGIKLVQQKLRKYNLTDGEYNAIVTNQPLKWEEMGYAIKDLMLTEQEEHDIKSLCAALCYPYTLLPHGSETTFNNQNTAEKSLYQNTIIPECDNYSQQLNECLELEESDPIISYSYEHLSVLQEDKLKAARYDSITTKTATEKFVANAITYNRFLVLIGEPKVTNGNYYYRDTPEGQLELQTQEI